MLSQLRARIQVRSANAYALFGHSFGALMAYELARVLSREGLAPAHLFISSSFAPSRLGIFKEQFAALRGLALLQRVGQMGSFPPELITEPNFVSRALPVLESDFAWLREYHHFGDDKLDCPVSVYGGSEDPFIPAAELERWRTLTRGAFKQVLFEGNHFYLNSKGEALRSLMAQSLGETVGDVA